MVLVSCDGTTRVTVRGNRNLFPSTTGETYWSFWRIDLCTERSEQEHRERGLSTVYTRGNDCLTPPRRRHRLSRPPVYLLTPLANMLGAHGTTASVWGLQSGPEVVICDQSMCCGNARAGHHTTVG